jgi:hypothetical protein
VQRARQRWLEAHAVPLHPRAARRRRADHEPRELLVGEAAGDLQQVLPVFLFGIGADQHVLRRVVPAAQVAHVHRVAAAPVARRGFQQQHGHARLARHQGGAQRRVAASDDQSVHHALAVPAWLYVFNDAGIGKDDAGVAALPLLQAAARDG